VVPKSGSNDVVYAAANYALPTGVDTLILEGFASQGTGNSAASGDALDAADDDAFGPRLCSKKQYLTRGTPGGTSQFNESGSTDPVQ
jgi:hypothetical protein